MQVHIHAECPAYEQLCSNHHCHTTGKTITLDKIKTHVAHQQPTAQTCPAQTANTNCGCLQTILPPYHGTRTEQCGSHSITAKHTPQTAAKSYTTLMKLSEVYTLVLVTIEADVVLSISTLNAIQSTAYAARCCTGALQLLGHHILAATARPASANNTGYINSQEAPKPDGSSTLPGSMASCQYGGSCSQSMLDLTWASGKKAAY
jgi:hypothetical protein